MEFKDLNILDVGNSINITGVVYSGDDKHLLCFFPGHHGDITVGQGMPFITSPDGVEVDITALNMDRGQWVQFLRQTDIMETEVLAQAGDDMKITKAILRKSARQISQQVSWAVFRRDGYACRYCADDQCPLTVDHLVLWEEGGPSIEVNLVAACKKCNKTRGNTQYADWLEHNRYKQRAKNLTPEQREANLALVPTLDAIPRMVHKPTRRH